jgi:hypothetical protein
MAIWEDSSVEALTGILDENVVRRASSVDARVVEIVKAVRVGRSKIEKMTVSRKFIFILLSKNNFVSPLRYSLESR